jgi:hypothetical protein
MNYRQITGRGKKKVVDHICTCSKDQNRKTSRGHVTVINIFIRLLIEGKGWKMDGKSYMCTSHLPWKRNFTARLRPEERR